jgi:5-formyltetrahydrofolate cyclo-ligase
MAQARLMALSVMKTASVVGLYMALPGEVDLSDLADSLVSTGRAVCVPAFDPECGGYALASVLPTTRYIEAPFGLREPKDPEWVDPASLSCVVVPGVAFDETGHRVGHGGGHYDRMLADTSAVKVGVAFDFQVFDVVPFELHDVVMDIVVTPTRTVEPAPAATEHLIG